jgi:hypothetical protein
MDLTRCDGNVNCSCRRLDDDPREKRMCPFIDTRGVGSGIGGLITYMDIIYVFEGIRAIANGSTDSRTSISNSLSIPQNHPLHSCSVCCCHPPLGCQYRFESRKTIDWLYLSGRQRRYSQAMMGSFQTNRLLTPVLYLVRSLTVAN